MTKTMQISLRAGERIYLNGAVVRVDRKVTLELLNDVTFLLESHVLQPEQTTTPLRQLYFVVQTMLMDPARAQPARELFRIVHASMRDSVSSTALLEGMAEAASQVEAGRVFDALRTIRGLYPAEAAILGSADAPSIAA
jgi:flagellar protein FlbT